jgi:phenylacetate-CoA ligase
LPFTPSSSIRDVLWPAVVEGEAATLLAMAFQLEQSQWWSPEELRAEQRRQLVALLTHARANVPFYRQRLAEATITEEALTEESWRNIPILTRQDIRHRPEDLQSQWLPLGHGDTHRHRTSGSTGEPLELIGTSVTGLLWEALTLRDDLWHRRDVRGRLVAIRSGRYAPDPLAVEDMPAWGFIWPPVAKTGPMTIFYHTTPIPRQVELLEARSPHYLLTYPSNARALCRHAQKRAVRLPDLRAVLTYGEPLTPDVRVACRETWGVPVEDVYGCEELGYLALQCPEHDPDRGPRRGRVSLRAGSGRRGRADVAAQLRHAADSIRHRRFRGDRRTLPLRPRPARPREGAGQRPGPGHPARRAPRVA